MAPKENIIARGAEAVIIKKGSNVIKNRIPKSYRLTELDEKLRKIRTRSEAKIVEKLQKIIPVPKIIKSNEKDKTIELEFIQGKKLSEHLENLPYQKVCVKIGQNLAKIHDAGIIHGDLTTSNMIYVEKNNDVETKNMKNPSKNHQDNNSQSIHERARGTHAVSKVYFIDFGLGFHSDKIEDRAVDLHLIKEALEAKHPSIFEPAFKAVMQGYKISKNSITVIKQLERVEKRGRYKAQY